MVKMNSHPSLTSLYGKSYVVTEDSTWDAMKNVSTLTTREESAFYHLSIDELVRRVKMWKLKLPRVHPHYAVKCNDNQAVLRTFALIGTGFDCASRAEMNSILSLGVSPDRIIFAHPCKIASHVKHARTHQVKKMTFDSSQELCKIAKLYPEAELVIRIRCDSASAQCQLGIKFGVMPEEAQPLLAQAAQLELKVVGVAFHVGSGCAEPEVFLRAIKAAKQVFVEAEVEGHTMTLLDIGGGFMGSTESTLDEASSYINTALEEHFPEECGVEVIAEPGRFMVAAAFTLSTPVINRRDVTTADNGTTAMHFIDDGLYGSFNCVLYDHQVVSPIPMKSFSDKEEIECSIWGPTCDGFDQVVKSVSLPESLTVGDWLVWPDMGAYTLSAAGNFNGFPLPEVIVHMRAHTRVYLEGLVEAVIVNQSSETEECGGSDRSSGISSDDEMTATASSSSSNSSPPGTPRHCVVMTNVASQLKQKLLMDVKQQSNDQLHRAALVDVLFQQDEQNPVTGFVKTLPFEESREMWRTEETVGFSSPIETTGQEAVLTR